MQEDFTQNAPPAPLPPPDADSGGLRGAPRGLLARLCFSRGDYQLLGLVDEVLSRQRSSGFKRLLAPYLHPHGIKEMAAPRALRIAYATVHLIDSLEAGLADDRLTALRSLRDEVMAASGSGLEKNTARVLLEIMKQLVRARDNPRRRLELARDFRAAVPGHPRVVRRLLAEHHLLEMPEALNQLAFDDHVHDAATKGRKSPTHLILDAWIKGIRRLTVIHYHFVRPETAEELLAAGAIMDMEVDIGIEVLARHDGQPVKLLWTPLHLTRPREFEAFLRQPAVAAFMEQGQKLSLRWRRQALALLEAFNTRHRPEINRRYGLALPPLEAAQFLAFVGEGQASPLHLARFIHNRLQPLLDASPPPPDAAAPTPAWREQLARRDALDAEALLAGCLSPEANPEITPPEKAQPGETLPERLAASPQDMAARIAALHGPNRLTLVTAEMDLADVLLVVFACRGALTHLDVFNLRVFETEGGDAGETLELLAIINAGDVVALKRLLTRTAEQQGQAASDDPTKAAQLKAHRQDVATLIAAYRHTPLGARIGTDSSGQSTRHHGMGLVVADTLPARTRRHLSRRAKKPRASLRRAIPVGVAVSPRLTALPDECPPPLLVRALRRLGEWPGLRLCGYHWRLSWCLGHAYKATPRTANIHTLGGVQPTAGERFQEDAAATARPLRPSPHRVNGTLNNLLKIGVGFAVAAASFASTHTWWVLAYGGPFIWFGITGLRNVLQAVLGGGGLRRNPLVRWEDYVSADRIADSLFFTGFSVPLLDVLVRSVLLGRGLGITTATNPMALYTAMALANGLYLASHNLYRGLPKAAAVGNLFRTVLSIPLALGLNQAAAWALAHAGVPAPDTFLEPFAAIVSKFASDCVAAGIEGPADRARYIRLRYQDYREKFKQLHDTYSQLELLYPDTEAARLLQSPKRFLSDLETRQRELEGIVIVNALDFLYFWMYQPHARTVLTRLVRSMTLAQRQVFVLSQSVLRREKEISRLLIDGLIGKDFAPALAFYLSQWRHFLDAMQKLAKRHPPAETLSLENTLLGREEPRGGP